jgi:hypothetical protein
MLVHIRDFVDVAVRARELGCRVPVRVALLPGNFSAAADAGEFRYHAATPHVRSAWLSVGLTDEGPSAEPVSESKTDSLPSTTGSPAPGSKLPLAAFFGIVLLNGPAWCLAVTLGLISSVLASHPKCASPRDVRFDAVVERPDGGCACLEYRGDAYEIVTLAKEVRKIWGHHES